MTVQHIPKLCPNMNGKTPTRKGREIRQEIIKLLAQKQKFTRIEVAQQLSLSLHQAIWYLDSMTFHNKITCHREDNRLYYFAKSENKIKSNHIQLSLFEAR